MSRFAQDLPWTIVIFFYSLACAALIAVLVLDQKYRCRTCLRRLRMPVTTGSWPYSFLQGKPRTEYICPFGHGTLGIAELQITGIEMPDWRPHEDIWKELRHLEGSPK